MDVDQAIAYIQMPRPHADQALWKTIHAARVLIAERIAIIEACKMRYDDDPHKPETLVEYIKEQHARASDNIEEVLSQLRGIPDDVA